MKVTDLEKQGMELQYDNGWQPSKYRKIYVCPMCELWQLDLYYATDVQKPDVVREILREHLLECANV